MLNPESVPEPKDKPSLCLVIPMIVKIIPIIIIIDVTTIICM